MSISLWRYACFSPGHLFSITAHDAGLLHLDVSRGDLTTVGNTVCDPTVLATVEGRAHILAHQVPEDAIVSHRCAAWVHWGVGHAFPLHLIMRSRRRVREGVQHYLRLRPEAVVSIAGLNLTSICRTVRDLGESGDRITLAALIPGGVSSDSPGCRGSDERQKLTPLDVAR